VKVFAVISLAALMLLSIGCSSEKTTAPLNSESLNYDVTGTDAPENVAVAMQELSDLSITVPDPVPADDPALTQEVNTEAAATVITNATLDDSARVNFRRIIAHLHDQMQMLRRCMSANSDPRLRRLAYGAAHAMEQGLQLLQNGRPRAALNMFHEANRMLNLAITICHGRG